MAIFERRKIKESVTTLALAFAKMLDTQVTYLSDTNAEAGVAPGARLGRYLDKFHVYAYQTYIADGTGIITRANNVFGNLDLSAVAMNDGKITNTGSIQVNNRDSDPFSNAKGQLYYSDLFQTLVCDTNDPTTKHRMGEETTSSTINGESFRIEKGQPVYLVNIDPTTGLFKSYLASASSYGENWVVGTSLNAAEAGAPLKVGLHGLVDTLDSSMLTLGRPMFMSSIRGEMVSIRPGWPAEPIVMGGPMIIDGTNGRLGLSVHKENYDYEFDGCSIELQKANYRVDVPGAKVYIEIQNNTITRDLPIPINGTIYKLNTTSGSGPSGGAEIALSQGTSVSVKRNFVYAYPSGAGLEAILAVSETRPGVNTLLLWDSAIHDFTTVNAEGPFSWQRYNNSKNFDGRGRIDYMSQKLRTLGSDWESGCQPTAAIDAESIAVSSGEASQIHITVFNAVDMAIDGFYVENASGAGLLDKYDKVTTFSEATELSDGSTVTNSIMHFTAIGVVNSDGAVDKVVLTLPTAVYSKNDPSAYTDYEKTAVVSLDYEYKQLGFPIARIPLEVSAGGVIVGYVNPLGKPEIIDLRGNKLGTSSSGASGAASTFPDTVFEVYNNADSTKVVDLDVSSVTTGTTRTMTIPNKDGTLALLDDISLDSAVVDNTAKISFDSVSSVRLADTSGTNTGDQAPWTNINASVTFETVAGVTSWDSVDVLYNAAISMVKVVGDFAVTAEIPLDTLLFTIASQHRATSAHRFHSSNTNTPPTLEYFLMNAGAVTTKTVISSSTTTVYLNYLEWIIGV